ncbi:ral guanine nucleotide dissociation stimulator-like [Lynx canadensis]|uniref:ral guanine nucleotide dissociation stimulator-like n=1 Tax=Lynx canadensis TaxID=61383 RepID=UPI0011AFD996|nr:ral guanine nucleotide dissociation stimulator-like [Lynx canadensis]
MKGTKVTPRNENENCVGWTIDAGLLKQRVEHLVPAFLGRDPTYVSTFLGTYPTFTTNKEVLEVLFMRYRCFHPEAEEDGGPREQEKLAISSILGTWLDHYPEDFFQPPDFTSLKLLQAYVGVHMPGSELQRRARLLYSWQKHPMAPAPEPRSDVPQERAPAISVVPTAASQPRLPEATSSPGARCVRQSETLTAASPPGQEVLPALADSQELEEPPAPLVDPEHEQPPAPAGGVTEGLQQPPPAAEQPASAPQQRLTSAAAPKDEFPDLVIAFFVISVVVIEMVFRGRRGGGIASRSAPASAGTPPARPKTEAPGKRVPRPGLWLQEQREQRGRHPPSSCTTSKASTVTVDSILRISATIRSCFSSPHC